MTVVPYVGYVWAAYGISLIALAMTALVTVAAWRKAKRTLAGRRIEDSVTNL